MVSLTLCYFLSTHFKSHLLKGKQNRNKLFINAKIINLIAKELLKRDLDY